jgi:hypothetical protein
MGSFSTSAKNSMLGGITPAQASLHSGDPGALGANNELSGGSPAYARKNVTFNAASSGSRALNADVTFDVSAGSTVAYVGYWASGPTFLGSDQVTSEAFAGQGTYTLTASGTTLSLSD